MRKLITLCFFIFFCLISIIGFLFIIKSKNYVLENKKIANILENSILENNFTPKIKTDENKLIEIDLSNNKIYIFENNKIKEVIPIAYQGPYGKWYQTPTGYFRIGLKKEKHISSLFPVYMNYAVQMYEDFFIHEIPYYLNGERVSNEFTGGCIRLEKKYAKFFFNSVSPGDLIVSYLTFNNLKIKDNFHPPVDHKNFFIRQRFNNPLRINYYRLDNRKIDYLQHAGIDLAPLSTAKNLNVYSIYDGKIVKIVFNGKDDHGLGNTIIIEHNIGTNTIYSLYGHLASINQNLKEGDFVKKGEVIGKIGATGYGCNYWRIGKDGCNNSNSLDEHLHFEIKTKPLLESPEMAVCKINNKENKCFGYTPNNPDKYGYLDPLIFLFEKTK